MEGDAAAAHALREEGVVLVVLPLHHGTDRLPGDQVVADRVHRRDPRGGGAGIGVPRQPAVGGVGHVEPALEGRDARVLDPTRVDVGRRRQDRLLETIPVHAVARHRVADVGDEVGPLGPVVHVEEAVVDDHRGVEDVDGLPCVERVRPQHGVLGTTYELHRGTVVMVSEKGCGRRGASRPGRCPARRRRWRPRHLPFRLGNVSAL